jgi:hypothetical protein
MNGRRVYGKAPHELEVGDYGRWDADKGNWHARVPDGKLANLGAHTVVEHEDGSITVSPSILVTQPGAWPPEWHGWLERGVWRQA